MEYIHFLYVGFGIFLLYLGGEYLLKSSVSIATYFRVPNLLIGVTIVSFSTSAPELFTSLISSFKGKNEIIVSNVIGSNIINMLLALPLTGMFLKIETDFKRLKFSFIILFLLMFLLLLLSFDFNSVAFFKMPYYRMSSLIIFIVFLSYLFLFYREEKKYNTVAKDLEGVSYAYGWRFLSLNAFTLMLSMYFLYLGSKLLVDSSVYIAHNIFNVSEKVIGIVLVAFGTSIPEIVVSAFSVIKKEAEIAIGNIIGSNIFNIGFILASSSFVRPVLMSDIYFVDFSIMVAVSLILLLIVKFRGVFSRGPSIFFLFLYMLYNSFLFTIV
ncbi:sodium:proton exchanger [Candidatus Borreliella tachyglossi]|uniref:Sodium:proton exchanger n=1 Tax=Candidatus Borreliella tachyglossi TaxID=1964448 RepID=A0A2S1LWB7_9SPIR|nr:calcium/sodium antiporter [Candidatus Borreliella tachyglossi]AWG42555.1 sodium:proton exchanger [Candidatus Borreliella tachyglossi]